MCGAVDLSERVALVTGGARGIGRAICVALEAAGATVTWCGRSLPPGAADGFRRCDVRDPAAVDGLIRSIEAEHGRLDLVVNNAGGSPTAEAATASPRFVEAVLRLNLLAPFYVAQAANRLMQTQAEGGSIINLGSLSALRPSPGTAAYGAAKAGLVNLTRSLAVEWAPKVRVNAVTPGLIATDAGHAHYGGDEGIDRIGAGVPLGRLGRPTDVAAACLFLASSAADYISGANIEVHGGGETPPFLAVASASRSEGDRT